jgi:hypothetical protein
MQGKRVNSYNFSIVQVIEQTVASYVHLKRLLVFFKFCVWSDLALTVLSDLLLKIFLVCPICLLVSISLLIDNSIACLSFCENIFCFLRNNHP